MRFAPDEDEIMVEDMLDRLLRDLKDAAPREDGRAPRPDPAALRARLCELGLWAAWLPEAAGGTDGGPRLLMALARGLGRHPAFSGLIGACVLPATLLCRSGSDAALEVSRKIASGEVSAAVAYLEPGRRWDLCARTMTARADADGYVLSGTKAHVAEGAGADVLIISAAEAGGTSLFLVPGDTPGLKVEGYRATDGSSWATVRAEGMRLPASARILGPNNAPTVLERALAKASFAASAEILGACEAALERTLDYMRTREQFGHALAANQALQFRAADLHTDIEMLRSQVLGAANSLAAGWSARARSDVAAAMALACETGDLAAREAIHLHGAIGMTRELGIGYYLLRNDVLCRWLGGPEHFREIFLRAEEEKAA